MTSNIVSTEEDLLGGLDVTTSEEVDVPDNLIDQVIGQDHARDVIKKAAKQGRHVLMIGSPGTGKSMLAKAMSEMMPKKELEDVIVYPNENDKTNPRVRTVPAGSGEEIVQSHKKEAEIRQKRRDWIAYAIAIAVALGALMFRGSLFLGIIAGVAILIGYKFIAGNIEENAPELLIDNSESETAPFKDATSAHDGALLGDVRHDPYQSGPRSTSPHKRIESGMIHEASKGVLFLDEINTLSIRNQQNLMTAIQEGEFKITGQSEKSSGSMITTEKVPTDFILVGAGNMDAIENMHPALRSRINGYGYEVYMDDKVDDTPEMRRKYAQFVAQEIEKDENIPHFTRGAMEEVVKQAKRRSGEKGKLTLELRDLGGLIRAAGDIANEEDVDIITEDEVIAAKDVTQTVEQQIAEGQMEKKEKYTKDTEEEAKIGSVNGLAVMGDNAGIVLRIKSAVTPSQDGGSVIATGKLQDIAQEAVQNVSALIKKLSGESIEDKDVHIQFVQTHEGVNGDSASVTVATAILSYIYGIPVRQDVAMTGSLSVHGEVLPVGGVTHKIEAAADAGLDHVIIPKVNQDNVLLQDEYEDQIEIHYAEHIADVLEIALLDGEERDITEFAQALRDSQKEGLIDLTDTIPSSPIGAEEDE